MGLSFVVTKNIAVRMSFALTTKQYATVAIVAHAQPVAKEQPIIGLLNWLKSCLTHLTSI